MKKLIIFPFNGNAIEAMDCINDQFELIAFADDSPEKQKVSDFGIPITSRSVFEKYPEAFVLAIPGSPKSFKLRKEIISSLKLPDWRFATITHPSACISNYATIGFNTLIMAGVVISNKAKLGNHVCILPNSVVHHDSIVGDYTLIGSSVIIAGYSLIGKQCYIGSGSNIINNVSIGENALIGLGSNVIQTIKPGLMVAGNPARVLNSDKQ